MNYYEHHLGDYLRDAGHLTFIEDAAYRRLIDAYYVREKALPADVKECQKLARCMSAGERKAVAYVLSAFFERRDDGYHQKRCDEEIAAYHAKQQKARESAQARWSGKRTDSGRNANASASAMRTHTERISNASQTHMRTACESDAPSPQSPVPRHQSPEEESSAHTSTSVVARARDPGGGQSDGEGRKISPEAAMAIPLREAGVGVTSIHPTLVAWVRDGFTVEQALGAVAVARERKPEGTIPAAYLDPILRNPHTPTPRANGSTPAQARVRYRTAEEIEREQIERGIAAGSTDAAIAEELGGIVPIDRIREIRAEVARAQH